MTGSSTQDSFPLAILIPLANEYRQFCGVFGEPTERIIKGDREYLVFPISIEGQVARAVCRVLGGAGTVLARGETEHLLHYFSVPLLVLAGIAGGTHDDVRIGDVVVASQIDDFLDEAKAGATGLELAGRVWHAPWRLTDLVRRFTYQAALVDAWASRVAHHRPNLSNWLAVSREKPRIHIRPIASSSTVVADNEFRIMLRQRNRKLAAVEMEAAGVAAAANERRQPVELLVVRGLSDLADTKKDDLWHEYAMVSAFEFVASLCRTPGFLSVGGPATSKETADAVEELNEIAQEYEFIHGTINQYGRMESSRRRSYYLRKLLARARQVASRLTPAAYDIGGRLATKNNEGDRIVAVAVAQAADNPVVFSDMMIAVLRDPNSRFEQTEALRFFASIAEELNDRQRRRLVEALSFVEAQETPTPIYPVKGDRRLLIELTKRWMSDIDGR